LSTETLDIDLIIPLQFDIANHQSPDLLLKKLSEILDLKIDKPKRIDRVFYDTFDWRIFSKGQVLVEERSPRQRVLVLRALNSPVRKACCVISKAPRYISELPDGDLKESLNTVVDVRALLPRGHLSSQLQSAEFANNDGKILVRLVAEESVSKANSDNRSYSIRRLYLNPVKGYDNELDHVIDVLQKRFELRPSTQDVFLEVARREGWTPTPPHKHRFAPDPGIRSDTAVKTLLLDLFESMIQNEAGVLSDLDTEFLHDFRVAIRRTRTTLSQFKKVLPKPINLRFSDEFRWLGTITSPLRDLDVFTLKFDEYRTSVPTDMAVHLEPLFAFIKKRRNAELGELISHLHSRRYHTICRDWRETLKSTGLWSTAKATSPIGEFAAKRISKVYRESLRESQAIRLDSPNSAYHELRKTCKKLRYLLGFSRDIIQDEKFPKVLHTLRQIQDILGVIQDVSVQVSALSDLGHQMQKEGATSVDTYIALGILIEHMLERQREAKKDFDRHCAELHAKSVTQMFHDLHRPENKL